MQFESKTIPLGLGVFAVLALTWLYHRRRGWRPVGRLHKIYLYPIKSGKRVELQEAECTSLGLKYSLQDGKVPLRDRVFVVYDEEKMTFVSGKNYPKMLFVSIEPKSENSVVFSHPEKDDIEIVLPNRFGESCIKLWFSEEIRTVDCGDSIAKWISEIIKGRERGLRVGFWPEHESWRRDVETLRPVEMKIFKQLSNKFTGAYSDLSGYLLINDNSVLDLKQRIGDDSVVVEALNFRPNLVIEGPAAYSEDNWDWVKIGDVVFRTFRPCTRCSFTTVDPNTGNTNPRSEPLKTLKKYRTMEQLGVKEVDPIYPVMGVYVGLHQAGNIKSGETVYIYS